MSGVPSISRFGVGVSLLQMLWGPAGTMELISA